jgi:hypothetical protein
MAHYELYNYNNNSRTRFIKPSIVDRTGFKRSCCEVAHNAYSEAMERGTRGAPGKVTRRSSRESSVWQETGPKESNAASPWRISAKFEPRGFWSLGLWKTSSNRERSDIREDSWVLALTVGAWTTYGLRHWCHKEIGRRVGPLRTQRSLTPCGVSEERRRSLPPDFARRGCCLYDRGFCICWAVSDGKCLVSRVGSKAGELCPVLKLISWRSLLVTLALR